MVIDDGKKESWRKQREVGLSEAVWTTKRSSVDGGRVEKAVWQNVR